MRRTALLALAACAACTGTGKSMSMSESGHVRRAPNMAAFLILANGHGRGLTQWASLNFSSSLLDSYAEWAVFEPARGDLLADGPVYRKLLRRIERAAARRDAIDLFIFAHDNDFVGLLDDLAPAVSAKLRLVYNSGCDDIRQYDRWLAHGVHAYVGHPDDSCSQMFVYHFQTRWWSGMPLLQAVGEANGATRDMLLDPSDPFGMACRGRDSGATVFARTAASIAGDGSIRIDTPVR
ncbi:MAG TPA: hypothetical protein VL172_19325 [Kofleriaceae bacterium]|nr:hypothetical protein [Kofleriaceae bacterium]